MSPKVHRGQNVGRSCTTRVRDAFDGRGTRASDKERLCIGTCAMERHVGGTHGVKRHVLGTHG
jgi:hypothetical protein